MSSRQLLEFNDARALTHAREVLAGKDWTIDDLYSPVAIDADEETVPRSLPRAALIGGCLGGFGCYAFEYYAAVVDYAIDVGNRPFASWIAFIPPALETGLLGAALGVVLAFAWHARLPRFHHPLFDVDAFSQASDNRYFLLATPPRETSERAMSGAVRSVKALAVHEVRDVV